MLKRRSKPAPSGSEMPDTMEQASRGSEGYPSDTRVTALKERRLLMAIRGISIALFMSIILNMVLAFIIVSLMPLKEIRPFLVQVAEEGTLVASVQPIQDTFQAKDLLTEKLVREYVVNRHEILRSDPVMTERWKATGYMGVTNSTSEYQRFRRQVEPVIDQLRGADAQRKATILSVNAVQTGRIYIVDFKSVSYDKTDGVMDERTYTATIEIAFRPLKDLTKEQMIINPTGFTVVNYSLSEKNL